MSVLILIFCILLAGCSPEPVEQIESESKGTASAGANTGEKIDMTAAIAQTEDIFRLNEMKLEYRRQGGRSPELFAAFKKKQSQLGSNTTEVIGPICDEVELISSQYRKIGDNEYRLFLLFRAKEELDDIFRIYIHGYVDPADNNLLPLERQQYGFDNWSFEPLPPTSVWDIGQFVIVTHDFTAQPIPYRLRIGFYQSSKGAHGKGIDLGWKEAIGLTEKELLKEIQGTDDIIDLYEIQRNFRRSGEVNSTISTALKERWDELVERNQNVQSLCGSDLIGFQYSRIGNDKYRVAYLFEVREKIKEDYRIYLHGYVDDNHINQLPLERQKYKFDNWSFAPDPPMTTWPEGGYVLITTEIKARAIPYNMKTGFYLSGGGGCGEQISLGWQADPGK